MAFRNDISVNWSTSPRIITVEAPSTEVSLQDLIDTCRVLEARPEALQYPHLLNAAGKENLGGGVLVGVTCELQNAVVAFEPRWGILSSGTITTGNAAGTILIDASGTLVTDGVLAGDTVENIDDNSLRSIIRVDSEGQLVHYALKDGATDTWTIGDSYRIWRKVQCSISGGNLVAVDENDSIISPVLPTRLTHVVRTSSSSATLTESSISQYASFGGSVSINVLSSYSGTVYPTGTPEYPVNNLADAHVIADGRGFTTFRVIGDLTIVSEDLADAHIFLGQSSALSTITIDPGADVSSCEFRNASIVGTLDGGNTLRNCTISTLDYVNGFIEGCGLNLGTITLGGGSEAHIVNCHSGVSGLSTPVIDFGGGGQSLIMRNYAGGIAFRNKTGAESSSVDFLSGQLVLENTVTNGSVIVRGIATLTDNSAGATIDTSGLVFADQMQLTSFRGRVVIDALNGVAGTNYPLGTEQTPVDNIADAITIAQARGLSVIEFKGDLTVSAAQNISGYILRGQQPGISTATIADGALTVRTVFENLTITGTVIGPGAFENVFFDTLLIKDAGGPGEMVAANCAFSDTVTFESTVTGTTILRSCYSVVPGTSTPVFDIGGANMDVAVRNYVGGMEVRNFSHASGPVGSIDVDSGHINITSSCTTGVIVVRGVCKFTNNTGGSTIDISGLLNKDAVADQVWDEDVADHQTSGSFGRLIKILLAKLNAVLGLS